MVLESYKVQEAVQNTKEEKGERKSFREFVKPSLGCLDVARVRTIHFIVTPDERGLCNGQ